MPLRDKTKIAEIKHGLLARLKDEYAFWSYEQASVTDSAVSDAQLIALTMRYLDLPQINQLFEIFSRRKIKDAWRKHLVPEGSYMYTLNRFFAWYYFDAKRPDSYLKSLQTRHLNSIITTI